MRAPLAALGIVGIAAALFVSPAPAWAQVDHEGPSFSCMLAPEAGVEEMICRDADLSRQDRQMAAAYAKTREALKGSEGLGALVADQRAWLRKRDVCVDLRTQKGYCLSDMTDKRIAVLGEWARLKMDPARATRLAPATGTTAGSRPPRGPSFDCKKARTVVERAICADRELSLLDRQMVEALRLANAARASSDLPVIATEQRAFLDNRNRCAARIEDRFACIQVSYEMRIQRLNEWSGEVE